MIGAKVGLGLGAVALLVMVFHAATLGQTPRPPVHKLARIATAPVDDDEDDAGPSVEPDATDQRAVEVQQAGKRARARAAGRQAAAAAAAANANKQPESKNDPAMSEDHPLLTPWWRVPPLPGRPTDAEMHSWARAHHDACATDRYVYSGPSNITFAILGYQPGKNGVPGFNNQVLRCAS